MAIEHEHGVLAGRTRPATDPFHPRSATPFRPRRRVLPMCRRVDAKRTGSADPTGIACVGLGLPEMCRMDGGYVTVALWTADPKENMIGKQCALDTATKAASTMFGAKE